MVNACLTASYNQVTWTGKTLRPNTDCNGDPISGVSQYLVDTPTMKTTFEVPPVTLQDNGQRANVKGIVILTRSTGAERERQENPTSALIAAQNSFSNVVFGYCYTTVACGGSQLAVVLATGEVKTLGMNVDGRLGVGNLSNRTTPGTFILPSSERGVAAFTSFLSAGRQISVITDNGKVYSAGNNEYGQLGSAAAHPASTPVQFGTLGNGAEKARYVATGAYTTYVVTDQNVYSAGSCNWSMLGTGCTSGNNSSVGRVALPAYSASNLNTQPVTTSEWAQADNVTTDSVSAFIRMKGGAIYGWGYGGDGQLGNSSYSSPATPVKVGTFGDAGQPFASKLAFDGVTLYVLDSVGRVWATGAGENGAMAGAGSEMRVGSGLCLDNLGYTLNNGARQGVYTCNQADNQSYEWRPDGTVRVLGKCMENQNGSSADMNPIIINDCNGSAAQQWVMNDDMTVRNPATGKCLDNANGSATPGNYVVLYTCTAIASSQQWTMKGSWKPRQVPFPAGVTAFTKITTDQRSVILLDNNGDAWGAGFSSVGELGTGVFKSHNPALKKVILPAGSDITDVYTSRSAVTNTYFVLSNGRVYGAGQNQYGQLGTGSVTGSQATPVMMQGFPAGTVAQTVRTGYGTTVILSSTGKVFTLGNNANGQLGDGTTNNSYVPQANDYTNQRTTVSY